jgi:hypothetical protein
VFHFGTSTTWAATVSHSRLTSTPFGAFLAQVSNASATDPFPVQLNLTVRLPVAATVALRWAQASSNATPSVLRAGSWIRADRIAA